MSAYLKACAVAGWTYSTKAIWVPSGDQAGLSLSFGPDPLAVMYRIWLVHSVTDRQVVGTVATSSLAPDGGPPWPYVSKTTRSLVGPEVAWDRSAVSAPSPMGVSCRTLVPSMSIRNTAASKVMLLPRSKIRKLPSGENLA